MEPLAARRAQKRMKVHRLQSGAKDLSRVANARPCQALVRIEIDDQPVRMLGIVDPTTPQVELDRSELCQREVSLGFRHRDERGTTFFVRQVDRLNPLRKTLERMALIEAILQLTCRASEKRDGSANKLWKHPVAHAGVVQGEVKLRYATVGEHLAFGIGQADGSQVP